VCHTIVRSQEAINEIPAAIVAHTGTPRKSIKQAVPDSPAYTRNSGPEQACDGDRRRLIRRGNMIEITSFTKAGGPLSKRISLGPDGKLIKDGSACSMAAGSGRRIKLNGVHQLATLIGGLKSTQAFALGALRHELPDRVRITTKGKLAKVNGAATADLITRTSANIMYRKQPAFALFDHDTKGMPASVARRIADLGGFWAALVSVLPELELVARVERKSTSSGIFREDTGEKFPDSAGVHVYVQVRDATDIPRFLKALHDRCWLHGLGWKMVGAGGQLLDRSIIDSSVGLAERLVFEAAPVVDAPLAQDQASRVPAAFDGEILDTLATCPPPTIVELAALKQLRGKAAHSLAGESAKAREAFIREQAERHGVSPDVVAKQCRGVLLPPVVLPFDDEELTGITVAEVLADPERYEGETLADPLEGVDYGTGKAKILRRTDGTVIVHSFAHGGITYELKYDASAIEAALSEAEPGAVADLFVRLVLAGEIDDVEIEYLIELTAKRAGVGKLPVKRKLKAAREEQKRMRRQEAEQRRAAERLDPRPRLIVPDPAAEYLPQMAALNDVLGKCEDPEPPCRNDDGVVTVVRNRRIPLLHTLTDHGSNGADTDDSRLPMPEQPLLTQLNEVTLAELIERHVEYYDPITGAAVHLPTPFVRHYVQRHDDALPRISGVATLPLVLPDGTILSGRGLDRRTGIVFRVPDRMQALLPRKEDCTPAAARAAMRFLTEDWLCDVSADYAGKCVLVTVPLTILERLLLPERPAFFITAGQRGGGKTIVCNMISAAAVGTRAPAAAWSPQAEERRKALFSYLLTGIPFLMWDNIPLGMAISCPSIEKALTSPEYADRVLGESNAITVNATTIMGFTGNNIAPRGDLTSRSLIARLNVDRPDPENREFKHPDPIGWTEAHRGKILAALYTILLANPRLQVGGAATPAETRFKAWWNLIGAAVEHAAAEPIRFRDMFLAGEAEDEAACSRATVLGEIRSRWPNGASANEMASYFGAHEGNPVWLAIEAATGKAVKVMSPTVLTWRLKALIDAPTPVGSEVLVLRYLPANQAGTFVAKEV
jgi:hypothetical protein